MVLFESMKIESVIICLFIGYAVLHSNLTVTVMDCSRHELLIST
jgi:hypothetical protein